MALDNLLLKLDQTITEIIGTWDIYSTAITIVVVTFVAYQVFTSHDPDAHPLLLARQAHASPVRQPGESSVFRSQAAPHGMLLNSGLNIKDPGDSKWSRGRDGDLRDVWRKVVSGALDIDGNSTGEPGSILTILGTENIVRHELSDVTRQINLIGQHIKQNGGENVAIYLPNSIEFLATLFACAFYDLTAILVPYDQSAEEIVSLLRKSKADTVVAAVGSFSFDIVAKSYPALKQLVWVVDDGSKHMDWNEVPKGMGGAVNVSTWQDVLHDQEATAGTGLPVPDKATSLKKIIGFWPSGEMIEYTQANLIAGIAGQLTSIPTTQRITTTDLFLPADSLTTIYTLVLTLSALFSNATVALNSVAGRTPDLGAASQGITPTIIVASAATLVKTHSETALKLNSQLYKVVHWFQTRSLVQKGVMPVASAVSGLFDKLRPVIGTTPGKLRLVYTSAQAGFDSTPLSSELLSDLRIYFGARIIYALTASRVAGAVTQTGIFDYRVGEEGAAKYSHFGPPVTSVEILCKDTKELKTTDALSTGEIIARGPAVVDEEASTGVTGKINGDHTLALV